MTLASSPSRLFCPSVLRLVTTLPWEPLLAPSCICPLGSHPSRGHFPSPPGPAGPATPGSSVVSESAVSWAAGARAVLRCQSPRMVWTQDRLHDRQRVVHWDLSGGPAGGSARRLVDMYSAGEQRVYEPRDSGRLLLTPTAFQDGNFSLLIRGTARGTERGRGCGGAGGGAGEAAELIAGFPRCVAVEDTDEGLYTCNLHHHYCHLYESLAVRLEVTDDRECVPLPVCALPPLPPPPAPLPPGTLPARGP